MKLGPPAGSFPVDFGRLGEDGQPPVNGLAQVSCWQVQQWLPFDRHAGVVSGVIHDAFGVHHQPWLTVSPQDVSGVQVPMDQQAGLDTAQVADGLQGSIDRLRWQRVGEFSGISSSSTMLGSSASHHDPGSPSRSTVPRANDSGTTITEAP
jgi:hypothetical protein